MIKYNLICKCGKNSFESWFSSSSEFDISSCKKKLVKCIYCESSSVIKNSVMAPNLKSKSNKVFKKTNIEKNIKRQLTLDFQKIYRKKLHRCW